MAVDIVSRREAKALGLTHYFTGKPCKRGHVAPRFLGGRCVECKRAVDHLEGSRAKAREYQKRYRSDPSNRDKARDKSRRYRAENPEKVREIKKKYHYANSEKTAAYLKRWRAENQEKVRADLRRWRNANPEKRREADMRRRAQKAKAPTGDKDLIVKQIAKWRAAKRLKCYLCGSVIKQGDMHADHIIPLSKGGMHTVENLAPACSRCNISKGARDVNDILTQGILL